MLFYIYREQKYSLQIVGTSLRALSLRSLAQIRFGTAAIAQNDYLCYANSVNWNKIVNTSLVSRNGALANCSKNLFLFLSTCVSVL